MLSATSEELHSSHYHKKMPELYHFTFDSLDCNSQLIFGENIIILAEGAQHGNPLSRLQFCESIQPTLTKRHELHWGLLSK